MYNPPMPNTPPNPNSSPAKIRWLLIALLGGLTALRLYYVQSVPLSEDEAYYWQWSRHLAWGYYDQGPMVAWLIRAGTWLCGQTELGVRLPAVLLSLGLSLVLYDFCRRILKDERTGFLVVLIANGTILFTAASAIHTYDTGQAFFWALAIYGVGLAVFNRHTWGWYLAGVACGLAMLAKYSAALLPMLIFAFLLSDRRVRPWLARPHPWLAGLVALAVYAPNLWWNAGHHWVSFLHTVGLADKPFNFTAFEFIGGQIGLVTPVMAGLFAAVLAVAWRQGRGRDPRQSFLFWVSLPVLALFLAMSIKSRAQANWAGPGYLGLLLAAGWVINAKARASRAWRRWLALGLVSGYLLVGLAMFHVPWLKVLDLPADQDPTAPLYGWPQLGTEVAQELADWPGESQPFLFGLRYQTASLVAFYTPGQPQTQGLFLPGDRLNAYVFWTDPCALKGRDGLGVVMGRPDLGGIFEKVSWLRPVELKGPTGKVLHRLNLVWGHAFKGRDARPAAFLPRDCPP